VNLTYFYSIWKGHFYKKYENDYDNGFRNRFRATIRTGLMLPLGCLFILFHSIPKEHITIEYNSNEEEIIRTTRVVSGR